MNYRLATIAFAALATACSGADGNDTVTSDGVQVVQVAVEGSEWVQIP